MATHCVPRGCGTARRFLVLVLSLCVPVYAGAADIFWDGGASPAGLDGIFSTVSNWSDLPNLPDRAPGVNDVAHFGVTTSPNPQQLYTVSFTTNPTNKHLFVEDDNVTFDLNGHAYILTDLAAINIGASSAAHGRLTIIDGSVALSDASIVRVGFAASGDLTVSTGGLLAGSLMELVVGNTLGTGELRIENNGDVIADRVTIGRHTNGVGFVEVTAASSTLLANEISVGSVGTGRLDVTARGRVESSSGIIGDINGSRGAVFVQGSGSRWDVSGHLTVGRLGVGSLSISDGGRVESTNANISGSQNIGINPGIATVAGANSSWTIDGRLGMAVSSLFQFDGGQGTLRVQSGGTVTVGQEIFLGARGKLFLEGGTLSTPLISYFSVASSTNFQWTGGTLHVETVNGSLSNAGGILAPGNSAGRTTIFGDYSQSAGGTLEIEIGGAAQGSQYDNVQVRGNASLDGNLEIALLSGFVPSVGSSFTILQTTDEITGQFDNVADGQRLATIDGTGSFVVTYTRNDIFLSGFLLGIPGDYNGDGTVNAADYTLWRDHLGQSFTLTNENPAAATPGVVDAEDYAFWKARFGDIAGSGPGAGANAAVPEPTSRVLFMTVVLAMFVCRRAAVSYTHQTVRHVENRPFRRWPPFLPESQ